MISWYIESIISKILDLTKKDTEFYFVFKGLATSRKDIVKDGNQVSQRILNGELLELLDKDGACIDGNCAADEITSLCAGIDCKEHDFRLIQQQKDELLKENNELVERKLNELKSKKNSK